MPDINSDEVKKYFDDLGPDAFPSPTVPKAKNTWPKNKIWRRLCRLRMFQGKFSTKNLDRLCRDTASTELTLVIHSEDVNYQPFFPNAYTVTKRLDVPADMHVDIHYREVSKIPSESYNIVLCTGLLEHIPDPERLLNEFKRILKPGGKLIISASAVFSYHESPDNFFHFTPYGFRLMFRDWDHIEMMRGASQPFETIGILIQRILIQSDIFPLATPFLEIMARCFRFLDVFVIAQYNTVKPKDPTSLTDSMMPSNLQAVVVK